MNPPGRNQVRQWLEATAAEVPVHLIGAGGCGMSGLGHLLLDAGRQVTGSDLVGGVEFERLRARGARVQLGHDAAQIDHARPGLVAYSTAIQVDNPELVTARERGIPCVRRARLLAALMEGHRGICVAGMHGKTTTTALLAFGLERLGAQPSYAIGADVPQLPRHAHQGKPGGWFVAETDESDGTLQEFAPELAVILNVDEEHLDHFTNLDAVCAEFRAFAGQATGGIFYCADDAQLGRMFRGQAGAVSFGYAAEADYRVVTVPGAPEGRSPAGAEFEGSRFEIRHGVARLGEFAIHLIGGKNISNAAGVIAVLHQLGWGAVEIAEAIGAFRGAARRQHELFGNRQYRVFDDYGHHPREIVATLGAMRGLGCRRLLVAFQPHRFTRTRHLLPQFARAFEQADRLWLTEVYAASEPAIPGVNGAALAAVVGAAQPAVEFVPSVDALPAAVRAGMRPGDLVLFLGAGDITRAAHELAARLRAECSAAPLEDRRCQLAGRLSAESIVRANEPLARRTTLRVGGPAELYVEPASEADLAAVLRFSRELPLPVFFLGRGSNLLVKDGGIRGIVICLAHRAFCRIEADGERLRCGAGAKLKAVAVEARRQGISGLEFLEGIPGSVGGALRMNAGAMGGATFDVVERVRFMNLAGAIAERERGELEVQYRRCPLFREHVALGAVFKGTPATREAIEQRMEACNRQRWESQPAAPSAGCIFKNPASIPAGRLIEELGLKGQRVGGAVVSDVHGNFIVNDRDASAQDILGLIGLIQERARSERGIELETEVEIVGEG
ncbi:MAG: UDP-N-acetylmuramate--L-alanine ligase [Verrucomicrobia bacterium]|nr:UDP-N-acetylmuramate--L-alanine ligase [Verrucomicrobiota bacterium]